MAQVLLRLPDDLVDRFREAVPARERSAYVQKLLEGALPPKDPDWLYKIAMAANADEEHDQDLKDWDATVGDGLDDEDFSDWPKGE